MAACDDDDDRFELLSANVECGEALACHGTTTVGPLTLQCDGTIEGQVWSAGAVLGHLLLKEGLPDRPDVVEVGSGTGIAGLAAAAAGASSVVLTDLPSAVPRLRSAIAMNSGVLSSAEVSAMALEWGDSSAMRAAAPSGCDLVLAADCLYSAEPAVLDSLRHTLSGLARPRDAKIMHVYEARWPHVVQLWERRLRDDHALRLERQTVLEDAAPKGSSSIVVEVLRLTDEGLFADDEEDDDGDV